MKKIYSFFLFLFSVICSYSQVSALYTFSQSTGTYSPITGGTVYGNALSDDERFVDPASPLGSTTALSGPGIPIGFNFTYNGQVYDRIAINYNGWISFGNSSLFPSVNIQSSLNYTAIAATSTATPDHLRNRIAGMNMDFEAKPTSELRVQTIGTGINQVCVIQWKDIQEYDFDDDVINFQIRLVQVDNSVQIVYGTNTRPSDGTDDPQVGLGGVTNADFNIRTGSSWTATTAGTTNNSEIFFYSAALPTSGLTYTWTIASCIAPSTLNFTNVAIPNATISWSSVAGAVSYEYAITTSATPPASGTNTTATSASVSGLPTGSVVFSHVRTNCGSGFSTWRTRAYVPCTSNITPANAATNVTVPPSFNFNTIIGATSYRLFFSTDGGATYPSAATVTGSPVTINGLAYNTTYTWFVRAIAGTDTAAATCATSNATTFTTSAPPPPPVNDECANAIAINPYTGAVSGSTISANQSLAPVRCAGFASTRSYDVWYSITPVSTGTFTISVTGNGTFDPVIGVYTGSCAAPDSVNCADATVSGGVELVTVANATAGTRYLIRVSDYYQATDSVGTFTISATGPALPVTGVSLSGVRNGSKTQLSWKTLTEINNAGFEIQRSADGRYFTGIANIASKAAGGNSSEPISYFYDDMKPLAGANYYRLKQIDKDGKISYSNIVYLKGIVVNNLIVSAVYPNPTRDVLKASVQAPLAETITFIVTDMMGKTISRQVTNVISGDNTININVANLPSGSYLLKAICRNGCETAYQKFTKQ
jgi:hypothetical protein